MFKTSNMRQLTERGKYFIENKIMLELKFLRSSGCNAERFLAKNVLYNYNVSDSIYYYLKSRSLFYMYKYPKSQVKRS